jgi:Flp pilus assembly protein TadD
VAVIVVVLAACGSPQRPAKPSQITIAAVERADAAEKTRDHEAARALYLDAIATAPDPASERFARRELADTLLHWGEYDAGARQLEAIVALAPDDVAAWNDLGLVRHNLGDHRGAVEALVRARDLEPEDHRPRIALAVLYWKLGETSLALGEYLELRKLDLPDRLARAVEWAIRELQKPTPAPHPPQP